MPTPEAPESRDLHDSSGQLTITVDAECRIVGMDIQSGWRDHMTSDELAKAVVLPATHQFERLAAQLKGANDATAAGTGRARPVPYLPAGSPDPCRTACFASPWT